MTAIEARLARIEQRNARVELEKGWETSAERRLLVAVSTYVVIGLFMAAIGVAHPLVNAIVPTTGFLLSTLTIPFFKHRWMQRNLKRYDA